MAVSGTNRGPPSNEWTQRLQSSFGTAVHRYTISALWQRNKPDKNKAYPAIQLSHKTDRKAIENKRTYDPTWFVGEGNERRVKNVMASC